MAQTPTQTSTFNSLPLEIKLATQHQHTALNRLITTRLPLCLPPHAPTPLAYADGLFCFGAIYCAFEASWSHLLNSSEHDATSQILRPIHIPQLLRSGRLGRDVDALRRRFPPTPHSTTHLSRQWQAWHSQIAIAITERPHVLLAYAWVMYMALFNGGRWTRAQLEGAGWQPQDNEQHHLSFWHFDSDRDGEDIKDEFKTRFDEVAALLSPAERNDVVQESKRIFEICGEMVAWLDERAALSSRDGIRTFDGFDAGAGADAKGGGGMPVVRTLRVLLVTPWRLLGSMLRRLGLCFRKPRPRMQYEKIERVE